MVTYRVKLSLTCIYCIKTNTVCFRDQFIIDERGYGKVVGRIKEMIVRGGENIYPKEIEDFLNTHPDIIECHVSKTSMKLQ